MRCGGSIVLLLVLASCTSVIVPPAKQPAPPPPKFATPRPPLEVGPIGTGPGARDIGVVAGPPLSSFPLDKDRAGRALAAFRASCPSLVKRVDTTGLTHGDDWRPACDAATGTGAADAPAFFAQWFETAQVGDGRAFATGYYEPEIRASRVRAPGYEVPVYGRPSDLVEVDLGLFADALKGKRIRGRVEGRNFVPYPDRAAIEQGAIAQLAPVIAWAADPAEFFFLQIQGSGRLLLPDGSVVRIGYDTQNGRDYTGIGALLRERGLLPPGQASMQGIVAWLHANPDQAPSLMRENKSFVFFREQQGDPRGALGVPVSPGVSVAADPRFVPLGAPVLLSVDRAEANGLWIAQDTGGAIKGSNRFDTFWGAGDQARTTAGGMAAHGSALLLLPVGTLARLAAEAGGDTSPHP